jgi:basic amino acid/polyamine antiporter, APA family
MSNANPSPGFQQRLGLFDSTMLVMGTMIGSGIFVVAPDIARDVHGSGWLMAVWVVAGIMTILGALSYAELAGMMPNAGGQYVYLREAYSPLYGFLYGWTCFLVIQTGSIAAVGVAFAKYLGVLVPQLGTDNIIYEIRYVDVRLYLPFATEPFFKMKHFAVSAGQIVAVGVIIILTWLNCRGVQEGKIVQNVMTVAKTLALLLLIVVGLFVVTTPEVREANLREPWAGIESTSRSADVKKFLPVDGTLLALMVMGGAMVGALFSADAWNNITFTAGEIKNPRRNLPLSLALGTGSVIVLYLLANAAYIACLPMQRAPGLDKQLAPLEKKIEDLDDEIMAKVRAKAPLEEVAGLEKQVEETDKQRKAILAQATPLECGIAGAKDDRVGTAVMELWSPQIAAGFMAIAIMISTFGCVNGMTLMGARLYYVMAQDNLFFRSVGTLNSRGVPAVGLILQAGWSILLVFSGTYNDLLDYVIFAVLVFYVLTVSGLFILRRKMPNAERPYKAFGYPVLPALYVVLCAVIMVDLLIVKPKFTWPGLIIVLAGIPVYFLWRRFGKRT